MALSSAVVRASANTYICDVISTADADVGPLVIPHGLASIPLEVTMMPIQVECWTSAWIVSALNAVNVELTAANAVGSGVAGAQIRVCVHVDPLRTPYTPLRSTERGLFPSPWARGPGERDGPGPYGCRTPPRSRPGCGDRVSCVADRTTTVVITTEGTRGF